MAHYTKEDLELYRHGQMSVLGRIACSAHLKNCPECAKLLDELKADDQFIEELRDSIQTFAAFEQKKGNHAESSL